MPAGGASCPARLAGTAPPGRTALVLLPAATTSTLRPASLVPPPSGAPAGVQGAEVCWVGPVPVEATSMITLGSAMRGSVRGASSVRGVAAEVWGLLLSMVFSFRWVGNPFYSDRSPGGPEV